MNTSSQIRKVYQGTADRHQMFRMFDRHAQRPNRFEGDASMLYAGEWFEITEREHDYMFEHIWSATSDAYRGYSDQISPHYLPGHRLITLYSEAGSARSKLLDDLTDDEIATKLPVQLRHLPDAAAAA